MKSKMARKDVARIALLGVLARRKAQLAPRVTISAPAGMVADMLSSLIQTLLQIKIADIINANMYLVGNTLTVDVNVGPSDSSMKQTK